MPQTNTITTPPSPFALSYTTCTTSELRAFYKTRTGLPARRRGKPSLARHLTHLDATATFPLFALPPELRTLVYADLLTVQPSPRGGRAQAFPQILRACRATHGEAQALLYEVNTATADVKGTVSSLNGWFPGLGLEEVFKTEVLFSVEGAAGRRVVLGGRRGEATARNVLDVEALVPAYVRRMKSVRVVVGVVDGVKEAARGRPVPPLRIVSRTPFAGVSQVVFAVASAARACKRLEVRLVARLPGVDHWRLLAGLVAFENVRKCEVDLLGVEPEQCARARKIILEPGGVKLRFPKVFWIVRDTEKALVMVRFRHGLPTDLAEMIQPEYLYHVQYAEARLDDLRIHLRDTGYMPFQGSLAVRDALISLRIFLNMVQTRRLLMFNGGA